MIAYVSGRLVEKSANLAVVDNRGIGYRMIISSTTLAGLPEEGAEVRLTTYMHVRENEISLFGFGRRDELELFEVLISISGIGPRGAVKILSGSSPERFSEMVAAEDVAFLTSIPGIGKKTAQRIIVELREKLPALTADKKLVPGLDKDKTDEVIQALAVLGLSKHESRVALEKTVAAMGQKKIASLSTEELIREALKTGR